MVPKIGAKMPEIPLFPSCLQPCMSIMHAQMHVHMHMCTCMGVTPNPPTPTKNLKAQILLEAEIWHIMSLDAKLQIFSSKFEVVVVGGCLASDPPTTTTPKLQLDFKSKKSSCSLGVVVGGCLASDPPTTTPKLQLDFKSKKSSCSLGVVVGGVSGQTVEGPPPPTTTPKST